MKIKLQSFLLVIIGTLLFAGSTHAQLATPLTGVAYSEKAGLLHMDYKTAKIPDVAKFDDLTTVPEYFYGPTRQFYISFEDLDFEKVVPEDPLIGGDLNFVARVSNDPADCSANSCYLKGFIWSDVIGWISIDGPIINNSIKDYTISQRTDVLVAGGASESDARDQAIAEVEGVEGLDACTNPIDFTQVVSCDPYVPLMYPRIFRAGRRGAMAGYGWNHHTGWLRLASDDVFGTDTPAENQNASINDWGVHLDVPQQPIWGATTRIGRNLRGYAWSQFTGWIKFSPTAGDTLSNLLGDPLEVSTYTNWFPDTTPPEITSNFLIWLVPGLNTVDVPNQTAVVYEFTLDPESSVNPVGSIVSVDRIPGETDEGCKELNPPTEATLGIMVDEFGNPITDGETPPSELTFLTIPSIGLLGMGVQRGFCKYKIQAAVPNYSGMYTYVGSKHYPHPDDVSPSPDNIEDEIIAYIRAGDIDLTNSTIDVRENHFLGGTDLTAYADGNDYVKFEVSLFDAIGNPIVDIHCSDETSPQFEYNSAVSGTPTDCPNREVVITADITNDMVYDLIAGGPVDPTPVKVREINVSGANAVTTLSRSDTNIPIEQLGLTYPFQIASYAPTETTDEASQYSALNPTVYSFSLDRFNYLIDDDPLPPLTINEPETPQRYMPEVIPPDTEPTPGDIGLPAQALFFVPPVDTSNPKLMAGNLEDVLSLGAGADLEFGVNNKSAKKLAEGSGTGGLSIDTILQYYIPPDKPQNSSISLMESHHILNITDIGGGVYEDSDGFYGWTDPFIGGGGSANTRYELFDGERVTGIQPPSSPGDPLIITKADQTEQTSAFHGTYLFQFDFDIPYKDIDLPINDQGSVTGLDYYGYYDPSYSLPDPAADEDLRSDGTYAIAGDQGVPDIIVIDPNPLDPAGGASNIYNFPPGQVDRSDPADLELTSAANPYTGAYVPDFVTKEIQFEPQKFADITISDINLRVVQEIAYRYDDQNVFTVFAQPPLKEGVAVKDLRLEAIGTIAGEQIVTGRQFDVVSRASIRDLQEQIRRNVSSLTLNIANQIESGLIDCSIPASNLPIFETDGNVVAGRSNDCVIRDEVNNTTIVYYEGDENDLLILGDGSDLIVPNHPYTIIVKGGANIYIRNNIIYDLDPAFDNSSFGIILRAAQIGIGANAYLSPVPTNMVGVLYAEGSLLGRNDAGELYYGGGADVTELSSQLYWKGSIASRNTIAGAGKEYIPDGVSCIAGDTTLNCAQRYDFDFMRRFNATSTAIANNGRFSGGGNCDSATPPYCVSGSLDPAYSLISVSTDGQGKIVMANSEDAPFFIEKDPRTINNSPPGFSISGGLESIQSIISN